MNERRTEMVKMDKKTRIQGNTVPRKQALHLQDPPSKLEQDTRRTHLLLM
jgi:hypothetical protein